MTTIQNHNFLSPLRYPGGKGALANFMKLVITHNSLFDGDYVELYAGGAGIAWSLLSEEYVRRVHINDLSYAVMAFWRSVLEDTEKFCQLVQDTPVTIEEWYRQRTIQDMASDHSLLEVGFSTFFLNRTNRSGILKGGIIGGKSQKGTWKLDARFHKRDLIQRIQRIGRYSSRVRTYNFDATDFVETALPGLPQNTLVYLDPPYFEKGQELYENHYTGEDHKKISTLVSNRINHPWIVSYDNVPEVVALYSPYRKLCYGISYSAQNRYSGSEVMFFGPNITIPDVSCPTTVKLPTQMRPH